MKRLLGRTPLPRIHAAATRSALRVLAYHGVPDGDAFAAQVEHLVASWRPVSLDEVHHCLAQDTALPPGSVLVTFDDGDRTVADVALPILRDAGVPAVVYVVAGLVDTDEPFWWDEAAVLFARGRRVSAVPASSAAELVRALKLVPDDERRAALAAMRTAVDPVVRPQLTADDLAALVAGGVVVGSHTTSHPCLDRCTDDEVQVEIDRAHQHLGALLGAPPTTFAYPNGNVDHRAERRLRQLGYRSVFLFDHHLQRFPADPFRLSRLRVNSDDDLDVFRLVVSGAHSTIHHRIFQRS